MSRRRALVAALTTAVATLVPVAEAAAGLNLANHNETLLADE